MTLAPSSSSQTTSQVRVGVRVRPLTSQENSQGGKCVVDVYSPTVGIGERRFTYDSVFDSNVTQSDLYDTVAPPLLGSFLDGYNATVSSNPVVSSVLVWREIKRYLDILTQQMLPFTVSRNRSWRTDKQGRERHTPWAAKRILKEKVPAIRG